MENSSGDGVIHDYQANNNNVAVDENMTDGGYIVPNPEKGYDMNPSEGYNVNPIPADEDMANPLDSAIPSQNGFGGGYDDILDTLGLGPQGFEGKYDFY
ncbi:hypothetical protein V6N11_027213 [Hibiscus sabdariffa]|uniref:Uncharacterized protein n=1 Tax=Hibiscus sabdariffa TaxID=183260 RepID=A0ABR2PGD6_9ROSI